MSTRQTNKNNKNISKCKKNHVTVNRHRPTTYSTIVTILLLASSAPTAFSIPSTTAWIGNWMLPPSTRIALGREDALRRDCEEFVTSTSTGTGSSEFVWDVEAREKHEVARSIFSILASPPPKEAVERRCTLFLPFATERERARATGGNDTGGGAVAAVQRLERLLVSAVEAGILGGGVRKVSVSTWPRSPATCVEILWEERLEDDDDDDDSNENGRDGVDMELDVSVAIDETKRWVNEVLGQYQLCPYTASMQRSAIGLESVNVREGSVGVRHSLLPHSTQQHSTTHRHTHLPASPAIQLCAAFWNGVKELADTDETHLATLLILAPPVPFDNDFSAFLDVCDNLIQPSVVAVGADDIIGKAWFHPLYRSDPLHVDDSVVLPGHAIPPNMVQTFVEKYLQDNNSDDDPSNVDGEDDHPHDTDNHNTKRTRKPSMRRPDLDTIANANDQVRKTPHATINILRRSQLLAAKELERASKNNRPNYIYARNVMRMIQLNHDD